MRVRKPPALLAFSRLLYVRVSSLGTNGGPSPLGRRIPVTPRVQCAGDQAVKRFGPVTALNAISLRIRPGEVVALLEPSTYIGTSSGRASLT